MKKQFFFIGLLFLFFNACQSSIKPEWPEASIEAKPWTRWWWMGSAVNNKDLTYNLEQLSKAGIGGVEITPIYGVKGEEENYIDYLSPKWMEMFNHTQKEASRLNMIVDMNMGTGWPFGGPEVSTEQAATKAIFQEYVIPKNGNFDQKITIQDKKQEGIAHLSKLMAYSTDNKVVDLTDQVLPDGTTNTSSLSSDTEWRLIALFIGKTLQKVKRAAPGGEGLVMDHFNFDAVQSYLNKFEDAFNVSNTTFPHSFFCDSYEVYGGNWTPSFLAEFEKRRGYKLENHFNDFIDNGKTDQSARIIADYRETIGELLKQNFTNHWTDWAHERGITIRTQAHGSPANLIDLYAAVDVPECETFGISNFDIPGLRKDTFRKENDGDPTTLKYASSAAHIAGKKYTSAETFTWLTEHFRTSLSQCKAEIDQMFVSGVNHVVFHGSTYSPENDPWPGWKFYASVDMSPTNSIWRDAPAFFEYITRCQSFLQYGKPDNDFLLYLPIYDFWQEQRGNPLLTFAIHGMRNMLPKFYNIVSQIRNRGYDVDYVSDAFIESSSLEKGFIKTEGGADYKALILPSVNLIPLITLKKVLNLAQEGATIIFLENYPKDIPGFADIKARRADYENLIKELPKVSSFTEAQTHKTGKGKILTVGSYDDLFANIEFKEEAIKTKFKTDYIRRKHEKGYHYFITKLNNQSLNDWVPLAINAKSVAIFDPLTGNIGKAKIRNSDNQTEVFIQLQPGQSIILKTYTNSDIDTEDWKYQENTIQTEIIDKNWNLSFIESHPNIAELFSLESLNSWTDLPNDTLSINMGTGVYTNTFTIDNITNNCIYKLNLGDVRESARLYINEQEVSILFSVPYECDITDYIKMGENSIKVEVTNLPANRIADYDRKEIPWRKFHNINFASISYGDSKYGDWQVMPSGLFGPVEIKTIKTQ